MENQITYSYNKQNKGSFSKKKKKIQKAEKAWLKGRKNLAQLHLNIDTPVQ